MVGIDANARDHLGNSALFCACQEGHDGIVEQLLAVPGIDASACDNEGNSPLSIAKAKGHNQVVLKFVACGVVN